MGLTSEQAKKTWADPEIRARRQAAMKGKHKKNGPAQTVTASITPTDTVQAQQ